MAKITDKTSLVLGTNLFFHLTDRQSTDISIDATNNKIVTGGAVDFAADAGGTGIRNNLFQVGKTIVINGSSNAANEFTATITAVTATEITFSSPSTTPVDEAAGALMTVRQQEKYFEFEEAGGLSFIDGVSGSAFHSKFVDLWATVPFRYFDPVTDDFEPRAKAIYILNHWDFFNADTRFAVRDTAVSVQPSTASPLSESKQYALLVSDPLHAVTDQFYFWNAADAEMDPPTAAVMTGYINQLVLIYDGPNVIDNRGDWWVRCAEPGKTVAMQLRSLNYAEKVAVTVTNQIDPKLVADDATIAAGGIYENIVIEEDADSAQIVTVDGADYTVERSVEAANQSNETVHEKINWLQRQPININADGTGPAIRGDKSIPFTSFVGENLYLDGFMTNIKATERNFVTFIDASGTEFAYPRVAGVTVSVPSSFAGATAQIGLIVRDTFGSSAAVPVQDELGNDLIDIVMDAASKSFAVVYPGSDIELAVIFEHPGVAIPYVDKENYSIQNLASQTFNLSPQQDGSYVA